MAVTRPAMGASTGISIFIDSRMATVWPSSTSSSKDTTTFQTVPAICARTAVATVPWSCLAVCTGLAGAEREGPGEGHRLTGWELRRLSGAFNAGAGGRAGELAGHRGRADPTARGHADVGHRGTRRLELIGASLDLGLHALHRSDDVALTKRDQLDRSGLGSAIVASAL